MASARKTGGNVEGRGSVVIQSNVPAFACWGLKETRQPVSGTKFGPGTSRIQSGNAGYGPVSCVVGRAIQQSQNLLMEEYLRTACVWCFKCGAVF